MAVKDFGSTILSDVEMAALEIDGSISVVLVICYRTLLEKPGFFLPDMDNLSLLGLPVVRKSRFFGQKPGF